MSIGEMALLGFIIAAFLVFAGTLAWASQAGASQARVAERPRASARHSQDEPHGLGSAGA